MSDSVNEQGKLAYLEALRGIACLVVVLAHFVCGFYPALYFGTAGPVHSGKNIEEFISATPINLLYNGTFSVFIFFVLSGFVLTFRIFKDRSAPIYLVPIIVKRYVRLFPPVAFSVLLSYLLLKLSLFYNQPVGVITKSGWLAGFLNFEPSLRTALNESFVGAFFRWEASYNPVIYTMTFELYGSIFVFVFAALFANRRWRYIAYAAAIIGTGRSVYAAFALGMLLSDLFTSRPDLFGNKRYIFLYGILLLIGLFMGSYPPFRGSGGTMYAFMEPFASVRVYYTMGATLILLSLLKLPRLQAFLSSKPFIFLGKISFSMYVLHLLVIFSFGCAVFKTLVPFFSYHVAFLIMFSATMPIILLLSALTNRLLDAQGIKLSHAVYGLAVRMRRRYGRIAFKLLSLPLRYRSLYRVLFTDR